MTRCCGWIEEQVEGFALLLNRRRATDCCRVLQLMGETHYATED